MAERGIGWEQEMLEGGDCGRSGLDGDGGAPERSPAIEVDKAREPSGVILRGGEGNKAGGRRRRRRRRRGILLEIEDYHFRHNIFCNDTLIYMSKGPHNSTKF